MIQPKVLLNEVHDLRTGQVGQEHATRDCLQSRTRRAGEAFPPAWRSPFKTGAEPCATPRARAVSNKPP
jgi:hypothetical protein